MTFRPLLAATVEDIKQVIYPKFVSPKLDGIRCIIWNGQAVSRNLKPIRNRYVQACLKGLPNGLDGELIVGSPTGELVFNRTTSGVMSEHGEPDFKFYIFDQVITDKDYYYRLMNLPGRIGAQYKFIVVVEQHGIPNEEQLLSLEEYYLDKGYEGLILRSYEGKYKFGRSTLNEQILLKLKRFKDGEVVITGFDEGVHNLNDPTTDALGYTKRSTHQDNRVGSNRIGTLFGRDLVSQSALVISPGRMTQDERAKYFAHPELIVGRIAKYKCFEYGKVNASRFCTFQGFRDPDDLS